MNLSKSILSALFAALTAVGGWIFIPIPFTPVPITLQVAFCLLAGALLGRKYGALSQIIYILLGIIGLPVFASGASGIGALLGATGGYIFGFVVAAFLVGWLNQTKNRSTVGMGVSMLVGLLAIYSLGTLQLALVAKYSIWQAVTLGVAPFILVDLVKVVVAAIIAVGAKKALLAANLLPE